MIVHFFPRKRNAPTATANPPMMRIGVLEDGAAAAAAVAPGFLAVAALTIWLPALRAACPVDKTSARLTPLPELTLGTETDALGEADSLSSSSSLSSSLSSLAGVEAGTLAGVEAGVEA
jgi:hypothetical protein